MHWYDKTRIVYTLHVITAREMQTHTWLYWIYWPWQGHWSLFSGHCPFFIIIVALMPLSFYSPYSYISKSAVFSANVLDVVCLCVLFLDSVDLCCEINLHHHNIIIIIRADLSYKRLILWATFLWFAFFENSFLHNFNETTVWSPAKQNSDGSIVQTKLRIKE